MASAINFFTQDRNFHSLTDRCVYHKSKALVKPYGGPIRAPEMEDTHLKYLAPLPRPAKFLLPVLFSLLFLVAVRYDKADTTSVGTGRAQNRQNPVSAPPAIPPRPSPPPATASSIKGPAEAVAIPRRIKYLAGEDPEFAKQCGWPVDSPPPLAGSILPDKRIVAYYGNPLSKRMGILGECPKEEMLRHLKDEVEKWQKADPDHPVQPALHLIAVVAQEEPGQVGKYRMVMPDNIINKVYSWAKESGAILFIDIQTGQDDIRVLLPRFEWILKNADVHLAIDPEFNLIRSGKRPGSKIGTYDAADINFASDFLQGMVQKYHLPPKVFIVHRFTRNMVTNAKQIACHPEVQVVMNMDGWGAPWLKRTSYKDYIVREPVQYTGFKLFYHNDTKKGDRLLGPEEVLRLNPRPIYIQYQ
jgi:hypothetical protein